jgi:hypothetical protein
VNAASSDTITLTATHLVLNGDSGAPVFIEAGGAVDDLSSGMTLSVGPASGSAVVADLPKDPGAVINLTGGAGGYTTAARGRASIDFIGTNPGWLTAAHFRIG